MKKTGHLFDIGKKAAGNKKLMQFNEMYHVPQGMYHAQYVPGTATMPAGPTKVRTKKDRGHTHCYTKKKQTGQNGDTTSCSVLHKTDSCEHPKHEYYLTLLNDKNIRAIQVQQS